MTSWFIPREVKLDTMVILFDVTKEEFIKNQQSQGL
jgi:hypothetical protein